MYESTFTVKNNIACAGEPLSWGLVPPAIERADADAEIVTRLKALGAVCKGSTAMDPLALGAFGFNQFLGNALNPKRPELICGGSSSGAASSVASGACNFALCTDSGGSARLPAVCCGVAAIKFGPGRFSKAGTLMLEDEIDCFGIIAPAAADLEFLCESLFGKAEFERPSFVIPKSSDLAELDSILRADFLKLAALLGEEFSVKECSISLPFKECLDIRKIVIAKCLPQQIAELGLGISGLPDEAKALIKLAVTLGEDSFREAQLVREHISKSVRSLVADGSILLTPALPYPVPTPAEAAKLSPPINYFLALANVCGLPALTLPCPCLEGLQFVGSPNCETHLAFMAQSVMSSLIFN